jgi:CxxC motif-containing protein (DUF1111 family)
LPGLSPDELARFETGREAFDELDGAPEGLGPRFNATGCGECHAHPATGGTSPATNPQVEAATRLGARNQVPSFITAAGPVREVRFRSDGHVHDLFTVAGRSDVPAGCGLPQPDFSTAANLSFRIPTPVFGAGLLEAIPDDRILANAADQANPKAALAIAGHPNRDATGRLGRFGWKAQLADPRFFGAEAYLIEQGVTNALFPAERDAAPACDVVRDPEDHEDIDLFADFMRLSAGPPRGPETGREPFETAGCALCHTPSLAAGSSPVAAIAGQRVELFSDLLVHRMGSGLADAVSQGLAGPDEFRTAPLWGVGQRRFLLHDGRTSDLLTAIQAHASPGSEASASVAAFTRLPAPQRQAILDLLREL